MSTTPSARRPRGNRNAAKTTAPADTQTPLAKSSARNAARASKAIVAALAERGAEPTVVTDAEGDALAADVATETTSIADLHRKGKTIAQIARTAKVGQDAVRKALDEAGVDYSADKNAKPVSATPKASAAKSEPREWGLFNSFESIRGKTIDPKSKRGRIVEDLASDANTKALQQISLLMHGSTDRKELASLANALNAALSAHYARVS
jgi:hypothetical protein